MFTTYYTHANIMQQVDNSYMVFSEYYMGQISHLNDP
jgi:hypothetical protein